jgi:hypothetical protein
MSVQHTGDEGRPSPGRRWKWLLRSCSPAAGPSHPMRHGDRRAVRRGGRVVLGGDHPGVTRPQPDGPVVVDTSVFGADLLKVRALLAVSYQPLLVGRAVFISFVTWPSCAMAPGAAMR